MNKLLTQARETSELIELTLRDKTWRPTQDYVRAVLAAYNELLRALERGEVRR